MDRRDADAVSFAELTDAVERLVARRPLFIEADATVAAAAQQMNAYAVSSLLVRGTPPGILTDRDLRSRVLAAGRGGDTPVAEVMSPALVTVPGEASVFDALLVMLEAKVHHLPVTADGEIVGLVTDTDLLRHQVKSPLYLLDRVEKLEEPGSFGTYTTELAAMVEALYRGELETSRIARIVSSIHDATTRRLLHLAEEALGPPPSPYAWIVLGSEGRREQVLVTDQDNALVYGESGPDTERYFAALAERVVAGFVDLGVPLCDGGFMATRWCHPLAEWERFFAGWMNRPEPQALVEAANFLDFRPIHGDLDIGVLEDLIRDAASKPRFLLHMARIACDLRPPLGFFRRVLEDTDGLDLKKGGVFPIVTLARTYALETGIAHRGTLERLDAASVAGTISREGSESLSEAFRFLQRLRLERQLDALANGREPVNQVRLEETSPLERRHLKNAFVVIRQMQEALVQRYPASLYG